MPPWTCSISCSEVQGSTSLSHIDLPDVHRNTLTMEYVEWRNHARNCRIYMTTLSFCVVVRPLKTFFDRPNTPRQQLELEVFFRAFGKFSWLPPLNGLFYYQDALYLLLTGFFGFDPYYYCILLITIITTRASNTLIILDKEVLLAKLNIKSIILSKS